MALRSDRVRGGGKCIDDVDTDLGTEGTWYRSLFSLFELHSFRARFPIESGCVTNGPLFRCVKSTDPVENE